MIGLHPPVAKELLEVIKETINSQGSITFARFMEIALYYPELGYYTRPGEKIGPRGDFYTSADVHPIFGAMLSKQLVQMWELLDRPQNWQLVEYGAGQGLLARDILTSMSECFPEAWQNVHYNIIEISPPLVRQQKKLLIDADIPLQKIRWIDTLASIDVNSGVTGVVFCNELVDAFPVHRVRQTPAGLKEIYVNWRHDGLVEEEGELSTPLLQDYFIRLGITLAPGQTAEVNLAARQWLAEVAAGLNRGFVLIIDYGMESRELYHPSRFDGTLRCYRQHRLSTSPLVEVGQQDITAHVNFTALIHWGLEAGLQLGGYTSQMNFLLNLGILDAIPRTRDYVYNEEAMQTTMAVKKLILPEGMGRIFKVLALYKGMEPPFLLGFKK